MLLKIHIPLPKNLQPHLLKVNQTQLSQRRCKMRSVHASQRLQAARKRSRLRRRTLPTSRRLLKLLPRQLSTDRRLRLPSRVPSPSRSKLISPLRRSPERLKRSHVLLLSQMSKPTERLPRLPLRSLPRVRARPNRMSRSRPRLGRRPLSRSTKCGRHTPTSGRTSGSPLRTSSSSTRT